MKPIIFGLMLAVFSTTSMVANAESTRPLPGFQRVANFDFAPDPKIMARGDIQAFYALLYNSQLDSDDPFPIQANPLDEILPFDSKGVYKSYVDRGASLYAIILKAAYVVDQSPEFMQSHFATEKFQEATHAGATYTPNPAKPGLFRVTYSSLMIPNEDCFVEIVPGREMGQVTDPGAKYILTRFDTSLGQPDVALTEYHYNFGRSFGMRSGVMSRTVMKVYPYGRQGKQSLIVQTTLSLTERIGSAAMVREMGQDLAKKAVREISTMAAN